MKSEPDPVDRGIRSSEHRKPDLSLFLGKNVSSLSRTFGTPTLDASTVESANNAYTETSMQNDSPNPNTTISVTNSLFPHTSCLEDALQPSSGQPGINSPNFLASSSSPPDLPLISTSLISSVDTRPQAFSATATASSVSTSCQTTQTVFQPSGLRRDHGTTDFVMYPDKICQIGPTEAKKSIKKSAETAWLRQPSASNHRVDPGLAFHAPCLMTDEACNREPTAFDRNRLETSNSTGNNPVATLLLSDQADSLSLRHRSSRQLELVSLVVCRE
ncbi:unnamed protein product [Protopolystoma xenopodis]|uniref:Uncharacterized protein n=1 Tax=Protopolystoma xenopodis TaxID=117903 RepID=A0A3S5B6G2_9PLAT|nr:unnamed protein product [Protopolystoma xenopodis]